MKRTENLLEQQITLSEIWDGFLFNELIQKAMLEIESRAPLRRLPKARKKWLREAGMRRGL